MGGNQARKMALGGMMAALAVVIMSMGTLIPLATFVCPVLCMAVLGFVMKLTGEKLAWAWYVCVAVLSMLLAPDKEAAAVFVFLGYYPIVKPRMDKLKLAIIWKLLLFNAAVLVMYTLLIHLFGMAEVAAEFAEMGKIMTAVTLVLGNVCMVYVDILLTRLGKMR